MAINITSDWIAPIITAVIAAIITQWLFSKFRPKAAKDSQQKSLESEDMPLIVRLGEGDGLPHGYFLLEGRVAKKMNPKSYKELRDYINQPVAVLFFSIFTLFVGFGSDDEFGSALAMFSLINIVALFPWRSFIGRR